MKNIKSIILLELLYRESSANREKILNMFMETVNRTDIYKRLEDILNSNYFIGKEAEDLLFLSNELLNRVRVDPREAIHIFFRIEGLVLTLEKKKAESEEALQKADFFSAVPSVVSKVEAATATKFYEAFYKALIYLSATLYGVEGIKGWSAFPVGSFTSLMGFVDETISKKVKESRPIMKKWAVVERYYSGGNIGASYSGCELITEEASDLHKIGNHKHPYIRPWVSGEKKLVEGYGFITGVGVSDVYSLFEGDLLYDVNASNFEMDVLSIDANLVYDPPLFLARVLGTNNFILPPEAYVKLLNRYFLNRTIAERKSQSKCVLCGRRLEHTQSHMCPHHFDYTQN